MDPSTTNATLNEPSFLVPPTRFLFQPAHRPKLLPLHIGTLASSPGRRGLFELAQRDLLTCASDETTCSQGNWCCGNGSTCSLDNGAFFCCAASGAGDAQDGGCARVCAAGDFQCGNVCCADGQTCMGAESGSPYCLNPTTTMSSMPLSTAPATFISPTTSTVGQTTSTSTMSLSTTSLTASIPAATAIVNIPSSSSPSTSETMSSPSQVATAAPTSSESHEGGIPMAAQVSIGVIVPVVCIILVFGLWMVLFRRSNRSRRLTMAFGRNGGDDDVPPGFYVVGPGDSGSGNLYPLTPPPAYTKSATTLVSTIPADPSSTATSVYGGRTESLSSRDNGQQGGIEMSTLSPSPVLPPLDQRLSVMDVRLSVASTTVGMPEPVHTQATPAAAAGPDPADDVHPGTPVDLSRVSVFYSRNSVVAGRDSMGVHPGTAL
ncbi:hypothetical protein B0T20DRAFT_402042 [Sordaria brevicollis]|uniref:Uncharacterized protein n=1 Tax=Sordaria brevicollis TaxID=83679 RepID=A0AAE0PKL4_SORBR|nr:hypothetical protein B0T20DRAFT_402042 [Sordaria brevicollis]